ncbi:MAG: sulfotransferase [Pirellulaceae bacterium]|nr:sulfotransferase [Pirellulaceae bacterium]
MTIAPIFSLGLARNGTTWLGNILRDAFSVHTAHHFLHYGSHESKLYWWGKYFRSVNRSVFWETFRKTDTCLLMCDGKRRDISAYKTFYDLYFDLMDEKTRVERKTNWTTKLCPEFFYFPSEFKKIKDVIDTRYQNAKYVGIQRDMDEAFVSFLNMPGTHREKRLKNEFFSYYLYAARYQTFYRNAPKLLPDALWVQFADLKNDTTATIEKISRYLEKKSVDVESTGIKNTSIRTKTEVKRPRFFFKNRLLFWAILHSWQTIKSSKPVMHCRLKLFEEDPQELISQMRASGNDIIADLVEKELAKKVAKE